MRETALQDSDRVQGRIWALACALAFLSWLAARIVSAANYRGLFPEDDAYYYFVVARHIAETGVSSFDGQSLTNGYHPLWLAILVLQHLAVGTSVAVTFRLEAMLASVALYLLLRQLPMKNPVFQVAFTLAFAWLVGPLSLRGMEVSLLVFCLGLFVTALGASGTRAGLWLGLSAAACVGARIDAAFFIAPALLFAPVPRRDRAVAFGLLGVLGAVYGVTNLALFGVPMPVSSAVKSLGGLQINYRLITQLVKDWEVSSWTARYVITCAALVASPPFILLSRRGTVARALAVGCSLGGLIFLGKLLFLSSWQIWPWYNFAVIFPLLAGFYAAGPRLADQLGGLMRRVLNVRVATFGFTALAPLGLVVLVGRSVAVARARPHVAPHSNFELLNREAVFRFGPVLRGERVAMGDRAGSFAANYSGSVVQLEGLVNDKAYLEAIQHGNDVASLLCARGVKYLLDYEADLGDYEQHHIEVMRRALTQFPGPTVVVNRRDELGRVSDPEIYDARLDGGDNILYLWRLSCPAG